MAIDQERKPLTDEEFDELIRILNSDHFSKEEYASAREVHPLNPNPDTGAMYTASADFLFQCKTCAEIGLAYQWYRITIDSIGGLPFLHRKTDEEDLRNGHDGLNLSKIAEDDDTEYYDSSINYVEGVGYVCDHCKDSIFEEV